eukprot:12474962-Alexandrium_andersonii.AAC.1
MRSTAIRSCQRPKRTGPPTARSLGSRTTLTGPSSGGETASTDHLMFREIASPARRENTHRPLTRSAVAGGAV